MQFQQKMIVKQENGTFYLKKELFLFQKSGYKRHIAKILVACLDGRYFCKMRHFKLKMYVLKEETVHIF